MTHYQLIAGNKRRSFLVVVIFVFVVIALSVLITMGFDASYDVIFFALGFSLLSCFFSYFYSDKIILTISGAKKVTKQKYFDLYTVTENLTSSQRMPMPQIYAINDSAPNAFATGRNPEHAVICVTTGLLNKLNRHELEAVIAHELSHIKNYDILLMSLVSVLVGLITMLCDFFLRFGGFGRRKRDNNDSSNSQTILFLIALVLSILSPIFVKLIQLAISRRREYLADASAIGFTKNPQALINALEKLSGDKEKLEVANRATAHLYIVSPFKGKSKMKNMFSTHPNLNDRIKALKELTYQVD
jgi:heat shock protein HtpX